MVIYHVLKFCFVLFCFFFYSLSLHLRSGAFLRKRSQSLMSGKDKGKQYERLRIFKNFFFFVITETMYICCLRSQVIQKIWWKVTHNPAPKPEILVWSSSLICKEWFEGSLAKVPFSGQPGPRRSHWPVGGHHGKEAPELLTLKGGLWYLKRITLILSECAWSPQKASPPAKSAFTKGCSHDYWLFQVVLRMDAWHFGSVVFQWEMPSRHVKTYNFHISEPKPSRKCDSLLFLTFRDPSPLSHIW